MSHEFVSSFVCNIEKIIAWCISAKKNYYNLTKNNHKFQASVTERCYSLSKSSGIFRQNPLKVPVKKLNLYKNFTTHDLLRKWFLRFPIKSFSAIYRILFLSCMTGILCIRIHICKKYFFPLYYS